MPVFNLSSKGETNPANFTNYLNDTVSLKPFSKIALIGAQLCRKDETQLVIVPPNTTAYVRFNPYDIFAVNLNITPVNKTYTLQAFITMFNGLVPDDLALRRGAQMTIDSQDAGEPDNLRLKFYHTLNILQDYEFHMYSGNRSYARQYWNTCQSQGAVKALPVFGPGNTGIGNNQPQIKGTIGASEYCVAMGWNLNVYTPPPTQVNGGCFNLQLENFEVENANSFIIGQPNLRGVEIAFGTGLQDTVTPTLLLEGPIVGTPRYNNPGAQWGNHIFNIQLNQNGDSVIKVWNNDTLNLDTILTTDYNPGEVWEVQTVASALENRTFRKRSYIQLARKRSNGLTYWFPNQPTTPANSWFNNPNSKATGVALYDFYVPSLAFNNAEAIKERYDFFTMKNLKITGPRACAGFRDSDPSPQADTQEVVNARYQNNDAAVIVLEGFTPIAGQPIMYTNAVLLRRYAPAEAPGLQPVRRDVFQLVEENQPLVTDSPCMIAMFANFIDDTAQITGNNIHTLISSDRATNQPVIQVAIANIEAWDIALHLKNGSVQNVSPLDSLGARINIGLNKQYYFHFAWKGTNHNTCVVRVIDINAAFAAGDGVTGYYTVIVGMPSSLYNLGYIGGNYWGTASDYNTRGAFYFADFRFYNKSERAGLPLDIWGVNQGALDFYQYTGLPQIEWFFTPPDDPNREVLIPTGTGPSGDETQYVNVGDMRPEETVSVVVQRPTNVASQDLYWWDLQNIYYRPCTILPNNRRTIDQPEANYAGPQQGLTNVNELEDTEIQFTDPQPDANNNVLNISTGYPLNIGPNNPTSRILMDIDFIRNEDKILDIQITNLPHRSYNGTNHMNDKTIYRVLNRGNENVINLGTVRISEIDVPERIYIPLENGSEYHINKLDVKITDVDGKEEADLTEDTYVSVEIL